MSDDDLIANAPNLWGQLYVVRRLRGDTHGGCIAIGDEAVALYGAGCLPLPDVLQIEAELTEGAA